MTMSIPRQGIITKLRRSRITGQCLGVQAKASAGTAYVKWDENLSNDENHHLAAVALCKRFAWEGELHAGGTEFNAGNVYVLFSRDGNGRLDDGYVCRVVRKVQS